jgi:SAM-dependent methyltransferase
MISSPLSAQMAAWQSGIRDELDFWSQWFETKGLPWPDDWRGRQRPDTELDASLLAGNLAGVDSPRILDVGAGPMTVLGKQKNGRPLDIAACDPLAPFYAEMADKHGVKRPIKTEQAFAEDLTVYYPAASFDLVHCRNALDHSFDPLRGIEEMLLITKPTGRVVLIHYPNEALNVDYTGLHQWNFDEESGRFIIWNKNKRIDATEAFSRWADIKTTRTDNGDIKVVFDLKASAPRLTDGRAVSRVQELLAAMLTVGLENKANSRKGYAIKARMKAILPPSVRLWIKSLLEKMKGRESRMHRKA